MSTLNEATVFIVDDDAAIRDALGRLISLKGLRIAVFASAEDFLAAYRPGWRGCLLTDLKMPGMSGLDLQAALNEQGITLPVIILTAYGDVATARAALKNGALDFLEKPVADDVLLDVLTNAIRVDAQRNQAHAALAENQARLDQLTPREREVLGFLVQGMPHRDIAARLKISPRTVEVYKGRMMQKLQCATSADLIRMGGAEMDYRGQSSRHEK